MARGSDQRGFALVAALTLTVLFFALTFLLMIESTAALRGASRFRAKMVAQHLAESAAELAAHNMVSNDSKNITAEGEEGKMEASFKRTPTEYPSVYTFVIEAKGVTKGLMPVEATVKIFGRIDGSNISVERTVHSL